MVHCRLFPRLTLRRKLVCLGHGGASGLCSGAERLAGYNLIPTTFRCIWSSMWWSISKCFHGAIVHATLLGYAVVFGKGLVVRISLTLNEREVFVRSQSDRPGWRKPWVAATHGLDALNTCTVSSESGEADWGGCCQPLDLLWFNFYYIIWLRYSWYNYY